MIQIVDNPAMKAVLVYTALLILGGLILTFLVISHRRKVKVGIGDGGNPILARAIRAHGNYSEHVPFALASLLALGVTGGPAWLIHVIGVTMIFGRIAHAQGLFQAPGPTPGRMIGMMLSWTSLIFCMGGLLWRAF